MKHLDSISDAVPHTAALLEPLSRIRPILIEILSSFLGTLVVMETGQLYTTW